MQRSMLACMVESGLQRCDGGIQQRGINGAVVVHGTFMALEAMNATAFPVSRTEALSDVEG
jgi:hypothetical protein